MLVTAVALAPLCVAAGATAATVTIGDKRTTPVVTSTAAPGGADISITNAGSVVLSTGTAVTVDSNNTVTNAGNITFDKVTANGQTGILVNNGVAGSVTNSGNISITDDLTPTDTDNDGDLDGPFAHGTDRYGIRTLGAFTGDVVNSGGITVEGNNSSGISLEGPLTGNLTSKGTITVTGDHSFGVRSTGAVSGKVTLGNVAVQGAGSIGVSLENTVGGQVVFGGVVTATGYRYTTRPADTSKLDADDLLQGGPAVNIAASMNKGVLVEGVPPPFTGTGTPDPDRDLDGDGVKDTEQSKGSIVSFGGAPAMKIGSATGDITLSAVNSANADNNFGLMIKGDVTAAGVYDGISATGIDIGGTPGRTVTIAGGIRTTGSITATATDSSATPTAIEATALRLGTGAIAPTLRNEGAITALATSDLAASKATAVQIKSGASTNSLTNSGTIQATLLGEKGQAVAIDDEAGSLTSITNTGAITARLVATDGPNDNDDPNSDPLDEVVTGRGVAIEASANTAGLTILQTADAASTTAAPTMIGDIRLGSGADKLKIERGTVIGDVSFGDGDDELTISDNATGASAGASFTGKITDTDGHLLVTVTKGTLTLTNTSAVNVTGLTVGAKGKLILTLDPTTAGTGFNVNGSANLASGAGLGVKLTSLLPLPQGGSQTFNLIHATSLTAGNLDTSSLTTGTPFLFSATAQVVGGGGAAGDVNLVLTRKTAAQLGLIKSEGQAYDAIYSALGLATNDALRNAILSKTTQSGFNHLYAQLLPEHSAGPLISLSAGEDSVSRAMYDRRLDVEPGETTGWIQELNFYADKDKGDSLGFRSKGFGVAGGLERGTALGAVGVSLAFTNSDLKDPESEGDENTSANNFEAGLYWRQANENWRLWARGAAGYAWFDATRQVVDSANALDLKMKSNWHGWTATAAAGASYEYKFGRAYYLRPELTTEYFYLNEDEHSETGEQALDIDSRSGHLFTAKAMLNIGGRFGTDGWFQPELRVGYRGNLSADPGVTKACFVADRDTCFNLTADDLQGGGPVLGFRLLAGGAMGFVALEGDAELMDLYNRYSLLLRAGFRF
jgi:hypothetical protein